MPGTDFAKFSGKDGQPTEAEKKLIAACAKGEWADCQDYPDDQRLVSAELVVALAKGTFTHRKWKKWSLHHWGIGLKGAIISKRLFANDSKFPSSLTFINCEFKEAVSFANSYVAGRLRFDECKFFGVSDFSETEIRGQFSAIKCIFKNQLSNELLGRAIFAQKVTASAWHMLDSVVEGDFFINSAKIKGQFHLIGSTLFNPDGIALRADYATFESGVFFDDPRHNAKTSILGQIAFQHVNVFVRLQMSGANFDCGESGQTAIDLTSARIEGRLVMPSEPMRGIINLSRAWCDTLEDDHRGWPNELKHDCAPCRRLTKVINGKETDIQHLVLDGFVCEHFEYPNGRMNGVKPGEARIRWLSSQSARALKTEFDPQPWRQCALTLRNMGYDEAAQQVSIARRVRKRFAEDTGRFARFINRFLHLTADYGYNPWKAVCISGCFILLTACIFWLGAASCGGLNGWQSAAKNACNSQPAFVQTLINDFEEIATGKDASGAEIKARPGYPPFHALPFAADLFVPLLDLGSDVYWRANTQAWYLWDKVGWLPVGWFLYVWQIITILFGSIMIAIIITGFTGLLTRDDKQG